jgi:hypothetical protein
MKLKKFIKYITPEIILDLYRILKRYPTFFRNREILKRNLMLRCKSSGKKCIFLGNGPSLDLFRIPNLDSVDVFACNDFFQIKGAKKVNITFYLNFDVSEAWINNIQLYLKSNPPKYFIFSLHSKQRVESSNFYNLYPKDNIFYLHGLHETKLDKLFFDITRPVFNIKNVILGFMLIANYAHYSHASLYGVDLSFLSVRKKVNIPHAYDNIHNNANVTGVSSYGKMCNSFSILLKYIELIDKYSHTKFKNCTPESFIDVLEFENLLVDEQS